MKPMPPYRDLTIGALLTHLAEALPDQEALVYSDRNQWTWEAVPEKMRTGRWSQTVYQVDDSPRYGGWGQFETQAGIRRWRSNWTWCPLARRDAVRKPVYDRYYSINRHQPTPDGWIHWQDNTKMGIKDGKLVPIVHNYEDESVAAVVTFKKTGS